MVRLTLCASCVVALVLTFCRDGLLVEVVFFLLGFA
jgi:hypothetical protein